MTKRGRSLRNSKGVKQQRHVYMVYNNHWVFFTSIDGIFCTFDRTDEEDNEYD